MTSQWDEWNDNTFMYGLRLQFDFRFVGMAIFIDFQNRGDQAYHSDWSDLDGIIDYLIVIAGFISRLGAVPLVTATEL